jgi:Flp pilus assembly protein protease CpaA
MIWFSLILLPLLAHIVYTDIRTYRVSVRVLVLTIAVSVIRMTYASDIRTGLTFLLLNGIFLAVLSGLFVLTSFVMKKKFSQIIGAGDLILLLAIAFNFAPGNFVLFVMFSALVSIIIYLSSKYLIISRIHTQQESDVLTVNEIKIPFAGYMSSTLFVLILIDIFTPFSTYNDRLFIHFLNRL